MMRLLGCLLTCYLLLALGSVSLATQENPESNTTQLTNEEPAPAPVEENPKARLQQVLELADWNESRFSKFVDGEPLSVDEKLESWRLLQRLSTLDERLLSPQEAELVTARQLLQDPQRYRGRLVLVSGRARQIEAEEPSAEDRDRFGLQRFYRTTIDSDGIPVEVTSPEVPQRWSQLDSLDQPTTVAGVMLKVSVDAMGQSRPQLVATHLAWYPTEVHLPDVNYGMSVLGILGVDVARFDHLAQRQGLTSRDAPAFYQTLAAMRGSNTVQLQRAADRHLRQHLSHWQGRLEAAQQEKDRKREILARTVVKRAEGGKYSVAPFFNVPRQQVGHIASFDGVVRSALRVAVEPGVAREHAGLDHYYQLALFTDDSQNFPLFFCVRELPHGFPVGDDLNQPVRVAGFFLKTWRFTSRLDPASEGPHRPSAGSSDGMYAPLFIGVAPVSLVPPDRRQTWGYALAAGVVLLLAGVWLLEWRRARRDRLFAATTLTRVQRATQSLDFESLDTDDSPRE